MKNKNKATIPIVLGTLGVLAGLALIYEGKSFIGIFGAIASAGVAYQGYKSSKE